MLDTLATTRLARLAPDPLRRLYRQIFWEARRMRARVFRAANARLAPRYVNIGSGKGAEGLRWWTGDVQEGVLFDEDYVFPIKSESVDVVFSSMFFEHITDDVAAQLLRESRRLLKPDGVARIIVPDFWRYRRHFVDGDAEFFSSYLAGNVDTWHVYDVPADLEHLFAAAIASVHNLDHDVALDPREIDLDARPPRVGHPVADYLPGYYCGPPPGLATEEIRERFESLPYEEFLEWVFAAARDCDFSEFIFDSWHKNHWRPEKLADFARVAGFSTVEDSEYGALSQVNPVFDRIEKPGHQKLGMYFNLRP